MAHQNPRSRHPVTWAALTILILAPIVGTLWVPFYARAKPALADFPFFYWYQLMWVPIVAITSGLSYAIIRAGRPKSTGTGGGTGEAGTQAQRQAPDGTDAP